MALEYYRVWAVSNIYVLNERSSLPLEPLYQPTTKELNV